MRLSKENILKCKETFDIIQEKCYNTVDLQNEFNIETIDGLIGRVICNEFSHYKETSKLEGFRKWEDFIELLTNNIGKDRSELIQVFSDNQIFWF